ncbi:hypothetical protein KY289_023146 [Solanum tuberosum]|nr:hypothetical protein KY289_023146 [Solanum tuberosum]
MAAACFSAMFFMFHLFIFNLVKVESKLSCPKEFNCGRLGTMSYPFSEFNKPYCGLSKIDCNNTFQYPKVEIEGVTYNAYKKWLWVNGIDLSDSILESYLANRSCKSFERNLSFPDTPSISFGVFDNITLFKCMNGSTNEEIGGYFRRYEKYLNCDGFNLYYHKPRTYHRNYSIPVDDDDLPANCSIIRLPLKYISPSVPVPHDLFELLSSNFTLDWEVSKDCSKCIHREGQCQSDSKNDFFCSKAKGPRGTIGYIAPEIVCRNLGGVSHKSDVYSYGMMVLEMVGGRKNVDVGVDRTSEIYFPHRLYRRIELDEELQLIGIMNEEENECARKMVIASLWCIQTDPSNRPSMSKVVEMLEGKLDSLQMPPKPYLYSPSRSEAKGRNDSTCPNSFSCGNFTDLRFPYSLSTQLDCGIMFLSGCDAKPFPRIKMLPEGDCTSNNARNIMQKKNDHFAGYNMYNGCEGFNIYYKLSEDVDEYIGADNLPTNCLLIRLPIHSRRGDLLNLLGPEILVEWKLSDECGECHYGGGRCQTDKTNKFSCHKGASLSIVGLLALLLFCFREKKLWYKHLKFWESNAEDHQKVEEFLKNYGSYAPNRYNYTDIKRITSHFRSKLGQGGFGNVYRGSLSNGNEVAVKVLNELKGSGEDFINKVASISRTSHVNIVSLVGFCFEVTKDLRLWSCQTVHEKGEYRVNVSYGMMVLEMVGRRKNVDEGVDRMSEIYFPHWLYQRLELDEELQLIGIINEEEKECARKMVMVSLWCIQTDPSNRPSMSKIVEMLEGNLDSLQMPPKPYLYSPSRTE